MSDEKLTDEERVALLDERDAYAERKKALRIIDAHAADRAALVAQLEALEKDAKALEGACARLSRERDAVLRTEGELHMQERATQQLSAEVTRLIDELAAVNADAKQWARDAERYLGERNSAEARARELETQVTRLTRERDQAREKLDAADRAALVAQLEAANNLHEQALNERDAAHSALESERADHDEFGQYTRCQSLVAQVAELTRERDEALREVSRWTQHARSAELQTCSAQEDLRIQAARANDCADESRSLRARTEAAESHLAAANALLERWVAWAVAYDPQQNGDHPHKETLSHLAAQPAMVPARAVERLPPRTIPEEQLAPVGVTEAERRVLEAMGNARVASLRQLASLPEGVAYASLAPAAKAELARREGK